MKILFVYATYSGTTEQAVNDAKDLLMTKGHSVSLTYIADFKGFEKLSDSLIIFATPSWSEDGKDGQPHTHFLKFMKISNEEDLSEIKTAFIGLGDKTYARFCQGIDIVENYILNKGAKKISKTLKLNRYQFDQKKGRADLENWIATLPI
jgi:flavodoxin